MVFTMKKAELINLNFLKFQSNFVDNLLQLKKKKKK